MDFNVDNVFLMKVTDAQKLLGNKVTITAPAIKGEMEEIIIDRQRNFLYKVKYWIDGQPHWHVCSRGEFKFDKPDTDGKLKSIK